MKDFLKAVFSNPRLWQVLLVTVLTYLGYDEAVRYFETKEVVEVKVEPVKTEHTHKEHSHKDWLPVIRSEIKKAKEAHNDNHHGGN